MEERGTNRKKLKSRAKVIESALGLIKIYA